MNKTTPGRFWEIDTLRGVAILMMVLYHLLYDLRLFGGYRINVYSGFWLILARVSATLFILLVGVGLSLSYARATKAQRGAGMYLKYLKRGLRIFSYGLLITLVTRVLIPESVVLFGILHFIGLSIILAYPFLTLRYWNLLMGTGGIVIGLYLQTLRFDFPWLLWLGFTPRGFSAVDHFPVLPWFGVILMGIFLGNVLYAGHARQFYVGPLSDWLPLRVLSLLGRHSLPVYLAHQPVLIAILTIAGVVNFQL